MDMLASASTTILIGEDDGDDRMLVEDAFSESDQHPSLRFAKNGVELMDYLHLCCSSNDAAAYPMPGLILLDLNMPLMDGFETLRQIKADDRLRRIPVAVWTTSNAESDARQSYADGADAFAVKPSRFREIQNVLRGLVRSWLK